MSYNHETPTLTGQSGFVGRFSWAMFDWANQPYYAVIVTFLFAPFFATIYIGDAVRGQELWGYGQSIAGLCIALFSPILGAISDASGARKPWLAGFAILVTIGLMMFWAATPGDLSNLSVVMTGIVLVAVAMEFSVVFNNAMLPDIVPASSIGRWSGFGWGLGYVGGLVALILAMLFLAMPGNPQAPEVLAPFIADEIPFGLDPLLDEQNRALGPLAAIWFLIFLIPLFLFTPDRAGTGKPLRQAAREGLTTLAGTVKKVRRYRNVLRFLIARMLYADGLAAMFAFGGIYAAGIFGWPLSTLGVFGIIISVFAAVGAFAGGVLDDFLGSKRTVIIAVCGLIIGLVASVSITPDSIFFFIPADASDIGKGLFASKQEQTYLMINMLIGICSGPVQAASRTLMARLAPDGMITEFFGLYALSGKATAFIAPFAIALITAASGSQRAGLSVVLVFLVLGLILFLGVREERAEAL